jgi:predicted permease
VSPSRLRSFFTALLGQRRMDRETDDEWRFHLEERSVELIEHGVPADEARRPARREVGDPRLWKEQAPAPRGLRLMDELLSDARYACRMFARNRAFSCAAVLTLALALGANTAMFSVVEAVILHPLPYPNPDRMVWIAENDVRGNNNLAMIFGSDLEEWRTRAAAFNAVSVLFTGDAAMGGDEPVQVRFACVSQPLTRLFDMAPVLGRDFLPQELEHAPQAPGLRASLENRRDTGIAILSDRIYRKLGGDATLLGGSIEIANVSYTIVGVLPPTFRLPVAPTLQLGVGSHADVDVVLNATVAPTFRGPGAALARLRPGIPFEAGVTELEGIRAAANHTRGEDETSAGLNLQIVPLQEHVVAGTRRVVLVLWFSVGFVLLIACVNIMSLLLARAVARHQESALRMALGAGRGRLMRQMLTENLVLAGIGGLAGVALSSILIRIVTWTASFDVPRLHDATLNARVLLFSLAVCAMTGVLLTVIPALRSPATLGHESRAGRATTLSSGRVRRWHSALVVCELGFALIPLTGAGLMVRSLREVRSEGAILEPARVLMARIQPSNTKGATPPAVRLRESDRVLSEIQELPDVRSAALWSATFGYPARIAGLPKPDQAMVAMWFSVSPQFREAAGVPLVAGRWFSDSDRTAATPVVVVSERFARRVVPGVASPGWLVGRTTTGPFPPPGSPDHDGPMTIIGVVADFRSGRLGILQPDDANALPQVFYSHVLRPIAGGELLIRTASNPLALVESVRKVVRHRAGARLVDVRTLDEQLSTATAARRFNTIVIVTFAGIAVLLAAVGVSGVLLYAVAQRTHEIGLRLALGARRSDILRMVLAQAGTLVVAGTALGLGGSAILSHAISGVLYGVAPTDSLTYLSVTVLLIGVAMLAAYLPARRATRLDPMAVLRYY